MRRPAVWLVLLVGVGALAATVASARVGQQLYAATWSPDGTHVAWAAGGGAVWVADADSTGARPVGKVVGVAQMVWESPSALLIDADFRLFRLRLDGRLTLLGGLRDTYFSTDASRRHVASGSPACNCPGSVEIFDVRTGKIVRVGSPVDLNSGPGLSPGGASVAYSRYACDTPDGECDRDLGLWVASTSGRGGARRLAASGLCPVWSPDGRSIVYGDGEKNRLVVVRASGGHARTLAAADPCDSAYPPAFSKDSRLLAFTGPDEQLVVEDPQTGRVVLRSPARVGRVIGHAWSPDGKTLLVAARPNVRGCSSLWRVDVSSGGWKLFRKC